MKKYKKYKAGGKVGFEDVAGLAGAFANPIAAIPSALNLIGKLAYNPASYTPAKMNESPMGYNDGGDPEDPRVKSEKKVRDYYGKLYSSKFYKDIIDKQGSPDWVSNRLLRNRLGDRTVNIPVERTEKGGSAYYPKQNKINFGIEYQRGYNPDSVLSHEMAHAFTGNVSDNISYGAYSNKKNIDKQATLKDKIHTANPEELRADLNSVRFMLHDAGIWNIDRPITQQDINKLKKNKVYKQDAFFKRALDKVDETNKLKLNNSAPNQRMVEMLNSVTYNDSQDDEIVRASYGADLSQQLNIQGGNDQQMGNHAVQVQGNPGVDTNYRNVGGQPVALTEGEIVRQDSDGSAYVWSNNPKMKHSSGETFAKAMKPVENKIAKIKRRIEKDPTDYIASTTLGHLEQIIEQNKNEEEMLRQAKGSSTAQAYYHGGKVGEDPIYSGGTLPEATVKAKASELQKFRKEYMDKNPKDKYIADYLKSPLASGTGNSIVNYPKRLDTEYQEKMDKYVRRAALTKSFDKAIANEIKQKGSVAKALPLGIFSSSVTDPNYLPDLSNDLLKAYPELKNANNTYFPQYRLTKLVEAGYPTANDKAQAYTTLPSLVPGPLGWTANAVNVGLELIKDDPNYGEAVLGTIPLGKTGKKGGMALFKAADKFYDVQDMLPADSKLKLKEQNTMKKNKGGYIRANDGVTGLGGKKPVFVSQEFDPVDLYNGPIIPNEAMDSLISGRLARFNEDPARAALAILPGALRSRTQLTPQGITTPSIVSPKIASPSQRVSNSPFSGTPQNFLKDNPNPLTSVTGVGLPNSNDTLSTFEDKAFLGAKGLETVGRIANALQRPKQYDTRKYNVDKIKYNPNRVLDRNEANYQGSQFDINTGNANTDRILRNNLYGQKLQADRDVYREYDQMQRQSDLQVDQYNAQAMMNVDNINEQIQGRQQQARDAALTSIGNMASIFQQAGGAKAHNKITLATLNSLSKRYGIDVPNLMLLMEGQGDTNKGVVNYKGK